MLGFVLRGRIAKFERNVGSPVPEIEWILQGKISDAALRTLVLGKALGNMLRRNALLLLLPCLLAFRFIPLLLLLVPSFAILFTPSLENISSKRSLSPAQPFFAGLGFRPNTLRECSILSGTRAMDPETGATLSKFGLLLRWRSRWALNAIIHDLGTPQPGQYPFSAILTQARTAIQKAVLLCDANSNLLSRMLSRSPAG